MPPGLLAAASCAARLACAAAAFAALTGELTASLAVLAMVGFKTRNQSTARTRARATRPIRAGTSQVGSRPVCCTVPSTAIGGWPSWWTETLHGRDLGGP